MQFRKVWQSHSCDLFRSELVLPLTESRSSKVTASSFNIPFFCSQRFARQRPTPASPGFES
uniref:Uncharacterized protein n=1 Tax=Anguilla anguilla TaxID=7936 RepID=A0A0E9SQY4_ANGAN